MCSNKECIYYSPDYEESLIQPLALEKCQACEENLRAAQKNVQINPALLSVGFLAFWIRRGLIEFTYEDLLTFNAKQAAYMKIIIEELDQIEAEGKKKASEGK